MRHAFPIILAHMPRRPNPRGGPPATNRFSIPDKLSGRPQFPQQLEIRPRSNPRVIVYFTAIVTVLLVTPFWFNTTGTSDPDVSPAGTATFTWYRPTRPGVSPAYCVATGAAVPNVTVTGLVVCAAALGAPVAGVGVVAPRPVQ